jgi:hypothetical protein
MKLNQASAETNCNNIGKKTSGVATSIQPWYMLQNLQVLDYVRISLTDYFKAFAYSSKFQIENLR